MSTLDPELPLQIGPYPIMYQIGSGGMGTVYCGLQHCPAREVAIKVMHEGIFAEPALRAKFLAEREIAGRFEHPNIIRVYAAGEDRDENPYYVMELARRGTLEELLRSPAIAAWSHEDSIRMLIEVSLAIEYAHSLGVLHRDLKPSNILIGADLRPRVTDFGVAKLLERTNPNVDRFGESDTLVGSWAYMAPEQAGLTTTSAPQRTAASASTSASDVYSLGAILYELLCGVPPCTARTREDLLVALAAGPVPPLRAGGRRVRYDVEAVVHKALERAPERRYASAGELAEDLRRTLSGRRPQARPRTRRARWISALISDGPRLSLWLGLWLIGLGALFSLNHKMLQASIKHNQYLRQQTSQIAISMQRLFRQLATQTAELAADPLALSAFEVGVTPAVDTWLLQQVLERQLWSGVLLITSEGQIRARAPADGALQFDLAHDMGVLAPDASRITGLEDGQNVLVSPLVPDSGAGVEPQLALSAPVYSEPGHVPRGTAVVTISLAKLAREIGYPPLMLLAPRTRPSSGTAATSGVEFVEVSFDRAWRPSITSMTNARTLNIAKVPEINYSVVAAVEEPPMAATALGSWLWLLAVSGVCITGFVLTRRSAVAFG